MEGRRAVILTGAGCSTESGIPDYRGPQTRHKKRNPIQYKEFISSEYTRKRYWSRSVIGWKRIEQANPNPAHEAIAALEQMGYTTGIITQNVDRLHHKAGNTHVVELHGALAEVICLDCNNLEQRSTFQHRLSSLNPDWKGEIKDFAPDGDAEVDESQTQFFRVPACALCDGVLKPNVVFFGENVPKRRVDTAWEMLDAADLLLVVGSSLTVYSGYRFALKAAKQDKPIAMINLGESRGDHLAAVNLQGKAGTVMPRLIKALS